MLSQLLTYVKLVRKPFKPNIDTLMVRTHHLSKFGENSIKNKGLRTSKAGLVLQDCKTCIIFKSPTTLFTVTEE